MNLTNRTPFFSPHRTRRPTTSKIIFISCEGTVTEEEYFDIVKQIFDHVKSKVQLISVVEDMLKIPPKFRSDEQYKILSKNQPYQLIERIEQFKEEQESLYEFSKHPDDEFWVISDVDHHTSPENIEKWNLALQTCQEKGYNYAISNPFFEVWLLLHHSDITEEDKAFAITDFHSYEPTNHFKQRLAVLNAPLKSQKHVQKQHYNKENIQHAIKRAKFLHNPNETWPHQLGTTVYQLLEKIERIGS